MKKEEIILNDYSVSCAELDSGCDCYEEIENEEGEIEEHYRTEVIETELVERESTKS